MQKMLLIFITIICYPCAAEKVPVAAIDWCPQLCTLKDQPGYVNEILTLVFEDSPFQLEVEILSWSRAIYQVKKGEKIALLSPAKAEAPSLVYPDNEIGVQRMCFFTRIENSWQYVNPESLVGLSIGIGDDTSIAALNDYIADKAYDFLPMHYDENFITKNLKMLDAGRIDTFIFTQNTTQYEIKRMGLDSRYKNSGCVSQEKIYIAFSQAEKTNTLVEKLKKYFDFKVTLLYENGEINKILKKYNIKPWR